MEPSIFHGRELIMTHEETRIASVRIKLSASAQLLQLLIRLTGIRTPGRHFQQQKSQIIVAHSSPRPTPKVIGWSPSIASAAIFTLIRLLPEFHQSYNKNLWYFENYLPQIYKDFFLFSTLLLSIFCQPVCLSF